MSFGFSLGDFLHVVELVDRTRKRFKGAPAEFAAISDETRTLQIIINDIKAQVEDDDQPNAIVADLKNALATCESVLKDLNAVIDTHTELSSTSPSTHKLPRRIWKRLKWNPGEAINLRSRLISAVQLLDAVRQQLDRAQLSDISRTIQRLAVSHDSGELQQIADWIAPASYAEQQNDYFARVQPGTGQWILADPLYRRWVEGPEASLLLPGIPGAGKTFAASIIINDLQARSVSGGGTALAYFYCSFKRNNFQSRLNILSALIRQLCLETPRNIDVIKDLYGKHIKNGRRAYPNLDEASSVLKQMLSEFVTVWFVIDALDECRGPDGGEERPLKFILDFLLTAQVELKSQVAIKILATTRPNTEIEDSFHAAQRLTIHAKDEDLWAYCDTLLPQIKCIAQKPQLHPQIKDAITDAAQGMFLLAKLHCDTLAAKTKPKDVLQALKDFHKSEHALELAYQETLQRIQNQPSEHRELARKVLICITYSNEPLTLREIQHALAVDETTTDIDEECDLDDPDEMISACAGLVTLDPESNILRLVHYTTQKFLENLRDGFLSHADAFLATCCLRYVRLDEFSKGHLGILEDGDADFRSRRDKYPFLAYSARFWGKHTNSTASELDITNLIFSFLDSPGCVSSAFEALAIYGSDKVHYLSALHMLAFMGLDSLIKQFINRKCRLTEAVCRAIRCTECRDSTRALIKALEKDDVPWKLAATSWRDSEGRIPLAWAATYCQESTVRLLIDLNPRLLDMEDDQGRSPLVHALYSPLDGGEATALTILDELDNRKEHKRPRWALRALHWAVLTSRKNVVRRLLDLDKTLALTKDDKGSYAIFDAARRGSDELGALILQYTGSRTFSSPRDDGPMPPFRDPPLLVMAARGNMLNVVKILLERGADINVEGYSLYGDRGSALHQAAKYGHSAMVELLLQHPNLEVSVQNSWGETPLLCAAGTGKLDIVKMLLARSGGVDINTPDREGQVPLHKAAQSGNWELLRYLLDQEHIQPGLCDHSGKTMLHWAAFNGTVEMVQGLLSEQGVAADFPCSEGRTALSYAAEYGNLDVVRFLLSRHDIDVSCQDHSGKTPLIHAARYAKVPVVALLAPLASAVNHKDAIGRTAMHYLLDAMEPHARFWSYAVRSLTDRGATFDIRDGNGETPRDIVVRRLKKPSIDTLEWIRGNVRR